MGERQILRTLFLLSCFTITGCLFGASPKLVPLDNFRTIPAGLDRQVLAALRGSASTLHSGRLAAELKLEKGPGREQLTQVVVFERPDKLRSEFFAPGVNRLLALLIVHHGLLEDLRPTEKVLYRGRALRSNIEKLLSVPFEVDELMCWLFGRLCLPDDGEFAKYEVLERVSDNAVAIRFVLEGLKYQAIFLPQASDEPATRRFRLQSLGIEQVDDGAVQFLSESTYEPADSSSPTMIQFELPVSGVKGELRIDRRVLNPDLSKTRDRLFEMMTPEGVEVEYLDDY